MLRPTLGQYSRMVAGPTCANCDKSLPHPARITASEHGSGWPVARFPKRQWLSVKCPHCNYESALWKLGIGGCLDEGKNDYAFAESQRRFHGLLPVN